MWPWGPYLNLRLQPVLPAMNEAAESERLPLLAYLRQEAFFDVLAGVVAEDSIGRLTLDARDRYRRTGYHATGGVGNRAGDTPVYRLRARVGRVPREDEHHEQRDGSKWNAEATDGRA